MGKVVGDGTMGGSRDGGGSVVVMRVATDDESVALAVPLRKVVCTAVVVAGRNCVPPVD